MQDAATEQAAEMRERYRRRAGVVAPHEINSDMLDMLRDVTTEHITVVSGVGAGVLTRPRADGDIGPYKKGTACPLSLFNDERV